MSNKKCGSGPGAEGTLPDAQEDGMSGRGMIRRVGGRSAASKWTNVAVVVSPSQPSRYADSERVSGGA
jgi:hypothetical protein